MIVRVLGAGQFRLDDTALTEVNKADDAVEAALESGNQEQLTAALHALGETVQREGKALPDDSLEDSDLILPDPESTVDEVRALLAESDEGLVPDNL